MTVLSLFLKRIAWVIQPMLVMVILLQPLLFAGNKHFLMKQTEPSVIDRLLADPSGNVPPTASIGSLFVSGGNLSDMAMDPRAGRMGDILSVVVSEQATATSKGTTSSKRTSSVKASISSVLGPKHISGPLTNLADVSGQQQLDGQGATSRETTLFTTLSAHVLKVLPNGNLIIEGTKLVTVNSEVQTVSLRGIVRPTDIAADNSISSNRVDALEVRINGRGVVNDAIHRPNILYRILLGILPF